MVGVVVAGQNGGGSKHGGDQGVGVVVVVVGSGVVVVAVVGVGRTRVVTGGATLSRGTQV
ncbi:hypothetical protein I546_4536 [Mycobacterium kansasii 732]|nr:hypothetical protein I546_4536 [Mycobacterium kansasii 732]